MCEFNWKKIPPVFFLLFVFSIMQAEAASLWINSSKTTNIKVGDSITATVYVSADGKSINNIEGELSASNLEIQSISSSDSIANMWVEQPTATSKKANFNGGVLNPGYSGSSGKVVTVSLRATNEGVGTLSFNSASVRANDGLGTDVLKAKTGLSVNISTNIAPVVEQVITPTDSVSVPLNTVSLKAPVIHSSVVPSSDLWYGAKDITFTWDIPRSTTALKTLLGSYPDSEPTVLYDSVIKSKTVSDIPDGVWYFHLKYKTPEGWSKTAHRKFKIDRTAPESITLKEEKLESGLIKINISAYDKTSYITKFIISTSGESDIEVTDISKEGKAEFVFPATYSGLKEITIRAFDSANNKYEENFSIDFPKVQVPELTSYPSEVKKGEAFTVSGKSEYANSRADLKIKLLDGSVQTYTSQTKEDGSFSFEISKNIAKGELSAWVEIFVGNSQTPVSSQRVIITVKGFDVLQGAQNLLNILLVIVPIIILILLLVAVVYFIFKKLVLTEKDKERRNRIKRIEKETTELIDSLKTLIVHDIHLIGADRSLTDIEEIEDVLMKNLLKDFKDVEKRISNRLKRGKALKKKIEIEEQ
jgi:hypothetical protein